MVKSKAGMLGNIKKISLIFVLLITMTWLILFFLPLPSLYADYTFSQAFYDEHHSLLRLTLTEDSKYRLRLPLKNISKEMIAATVLQEDQYFRQHLGINPISIAKAGWHTYVLKKRRVGASTITMQVARLRYHIHSKTFSGKLLQIIRALQLEMHYSKDAILEAYLNLAPYGNNIEGVGAASLIYFNKRAQDLNLPQVLTLAVIPQNPNKRTPQNHDLKEIRNQLFKRWVFAHPHDQDKAEMMRLPLQLRSVHQAPFLAPHFIQKVLTLTMAHNESEVITTLDLRLQNILERISRNYIARKANLNVKNAAVLLVDSRDMSVKALLGSADFFNREIGGQMNGTETKRSPGSTLKPFIYALALEQGLIHPNTVLKDVPHSFGSYNPENFDNDFVGPIKAKDALVLSRNIPAIYLAEQLKNPTLYEFLQNAEINNLKPPSYYGLSLVLGGAEISMEELTTLYGVLANDGLWQPLHYLQKDTMNRKNLDSSNLGKQLLSPESSFLILEMLKESPTGILTNDHHDHSAFKTGTSSRYRDAWTIGIAGPYILGVWIGNFDNQSNKAFVGKEMAAPLFFEIENALRSASPRPNMQKYPERMNLVKVDVCKESGLLPTRYCKETEKTWFIPGKSPIKSDTIHREIAINTKSGLRTCHFDQNTRFEVYEFWSSDLLKIFKLAGIARRLPPSYDKDCTMHSKTSFGLNPQIVSPLNDVSYVLRFGMKSNNQIPFTAIHDADVKNLYWFLNETFIAKTNRDESFFWMAKPGKYVLRVVDDIGRSDAKNLTVKLAKG